MGAHADPLRRSRRRPDSVLWAASLVMALGAVVVVGVVGPLRSQAAPSPASPERSLAAAPTPGRGYADAPAERKAPDRVAMFLERAAAMRSVERVIARAFATAPAPVEIRRASAPRAGSGRVARGTTPQSCLAQAVYYEARGEPAEGQAAVAQVVLNRARSGRHPADLCGVVFEGAARPGCQFSFACDPRLGGRRPEAAAWRRAQAVASDALQGPSRPDMAGVLNYHADYVRPRWAAQLERTAEIGRHIFYAARSAAGRAASGWSFAPAAAAEPAPPPGASSSPRSAYGA